MLLGHLPDECRDEEGTSPRTRPDESHVDEAFREIDRIEAARAGLATSWARLRRTDKGAGGSADG